MKIKIKVLIENEQEQLINTYNAIYIEDKKIIKYLEKDKTNVTIDMKNNILIRENNEIYMQYNFIKNKITDNLILIKKYDKKINLPIKTQEIKTKENSYIIKYKIIDSNEDFIYKVIKDL